MSHKDWKKWCRLCGKKGGSDIDITLKFENTETLAQAIVKYFGIIISDENACSKICIMCHDTINSIVKYNTHAVKVNEMFIELESNHLNQNFDAEPLREKFGLNNETSNLYDNEMSAVDFCSVQVKFDSKSKPKNKMTTLSSKCFLKTEILDVDELNILDEPSTFGEIPNDALSNEYNTDHSLIQKYITSTEIEQESFINSVKVDEIISTKSLKKNQEKCMECNICQKRFVTPGGLTIHLKKKHSIKIVKDKEKRSHMCNVCGKSFKRNEHLNVHKAVHLSENDRKLYDCPKCSKKFTSEWYVKEHIRIVHERHKPFICEVCGRAFGSNANLVDHRLYHLEEKKFKCPKCEKTFKCNRDLMLHVDIHDDTEYICPLCGIKLNTKQILRRHMIVHSDQNKYKCNFCSKQFKRAYGFKNHLILHTGLKPYQCPFCDFTFANGANCRKHQTTVHSGELSVTELKGKQKIIQNIPTIKQLKAINDEALDTS